VHLSESGAKPCHDRVPAHNLPPIDGFNTVDMDRASALVGSPSMYLVRFFPGIHSCFSWLMAWSKWTSSAETRIARTSERMGLSESSSA
jgi:hypothetical protein